MSALEAITDETPRPPAPADATMRAITEEVARRHDIPMKVMLGRERARFASRPRQEAIYRVWVTGRHTEPQIGRFFNRDHTTVRHAVKAYCDREGIPIPGSVRDGIRDRIAGKIIAAMMDSPAWDQIAESGREELARTARRISRRLCPRNYVPLAPRFSRQTETGREG